MPHFFDPHNLPKEQQARWEMAMVKYNQVMRGNEERRLGRKISDPEWEAATKGPGLRFAGYQPGHPKSALFYRLLEGKEPLPFAPPCAFSYPWYDSVETQSAMVGVMVDFPKSAEEREILAQFQSKDPNHPAIGAVWIEQTPWEILERDGNVLIVSFGDWRTNGYRWKLSRITVPAKDSAQCIICHHDPGKSIVTTRDELMAESRFHVLRDVDNLRECQDLIDRGLRIQPPSEDKSAPATSMDEWTRAVRLQVAMKTIEARRDKGLSGVPSSDEIDQWVEERFAQYLSGDSSFGRWIVDAEGLLHLECWELESITQRDVAGA